MAIQKGIAYQIWNEIVLSDLSTFMEYNASVLSSSHTRRERNKRHTKRKGRNKIAPTSRYYDLRKVYKNTLKSDFQRIFQQINTQKPNMS